MDYTLQALMDGICTLRDHVLGQRYLPPFKMILLHT